MLKQSVFKTILICGFILFSAVATKAGVYYYAGARIYTTQSPVVPVTAGANATAQIPPPYIDPSSFTDISVIDKITLGVDHASTVFVPSVGTVAVTLKLEQWDNNSTLTTTYPVLELKYQPFPVNGLPYVDKSTYKFNNAYKYKITVQTITVNGVVTTNLPANLYIDSDILLERYVNFATSATPISPLTKQLIDLDCNSINDEIQITWPTVAGVEEYQLEWTFVNDYPESGVQYIPASELVFNFKNNSTRISTTSTSYKISLTFEHGYLLYRVRGIGRFLHDPSKWRIGAWSSGMQTGPVSAFFYKYQITQPHEANKNWQYSATYAEEGKKKEVINYFDGSLRNRQSVTKINQDKNAIVGETIYDHQGRPAVNVLPVPVKNPACVSGPSESALHFYPLFNKANSTAAYSRIDFDLDKSGTDSCHSLLNGMDNSSGASFYYSTNNSDKTGFQAFVPDAEKFPFSQIEYTPDNTGRIRRQGGVGKEFQLDKATPHLTSYFYGTPAQRQLDRLFGSEVGNATHYKKNVVTDPQGQTSVTYLDQQGRTIATALAGDTPAGLQTLPSAATQTGLTIDLFGKDANGKSSSNTVSIQGDAIEFGSQLLVAFPSYYTFNYTMQVDTFNASCLKTGVCLNCIYDLEIKVTDDCGVIVPTNPANNPVKKSIGKFTTDGSGNLIFSAVYASPSSYSKSESMTTAQKLPAGNYTITKRLTINKSGKDFYVGKYFETTNTPTAGTYVNLNAGCLKTYQTFLTASIAKVDTTDCNVSCQSCINKMMGSYATLGEARDGFVEAGKGTEMDFDFLIEECNKPCKATSMCDASFQMMLMDVSPDGQYGEFQSSVSGVLPDMTLSIYNTGNMLPKNMGGQVANWHYPKILVNGIIHAVYVEDNGTRSKIPVSLTGMTCTVGSNAQYCTPAVDNCSKVYYDPATKSYYTYPENLKELADFMSFWRDSWAKSLVMYHPEYAYYESCLQYNIKPTNYTPSLLTSNDFDKLLIDSRTYSQAYTKGLVLQSYNTGGAPPDIKTMIKFNVSGNAVKDPFLFGTDFSNSSPDLLAKMSNFQNGLSMVELAAMTARCGTMYGVTAPNMPLTCKSFGLNGDTTILNTEWNLFKNMYLSEKQKLQRVREDESAKSSGGYNGCIGTSNFNPFDAGMIYPLSLSNSPFLDPTQVCSYGTLKFYRNKKKRFNLSNDQTVPSKEVNDYQMFLETNQSPMERNVQGLLNKLASTQELIVTSGSPGVPLQKYSEFSQDLYMALNGSPTPLPATYVPYFWKATSVNTAVLSANIILTNSTVKCSFTLNRTGTAITSWANVVGISQLKYTTTSGPNHNFTAVAAVANPAGSAKPFNYYNITGTTTFTIGVYNYTNVSVCKIRPLAIDLANLWSMLTASTEFDFQDINLSEPKYAIFLTPAIKGILGTTSNNLIWNYNYNILKYELYDQANPSKKLVMEFTSGSTDNVYTFKNMKNTDSIHGFQIDGLSGSGTVVSTLTGVIDLVDGATTPVSMGDCGLPTPINCQGDEYQVGKDLYRLLKSVMLPKPFNEDADIGASPDFTPLLQSIIGVSGQQSTTKYDMISLNSDNDYKESITYNLQCKCKISLWHKGKGDAIVKFSDLYKFDGFKAIGPFDNSGNKYNFYILGDYRYQGDIAYADTIFGESCLPLKSCDKSYIVDTTISPVITYVNPCALNKLNIASLNAQVAYKQYADSTLAFMSSKYTARCLKAVETLNALYEDKEYHYTLYYYDQAGNLVKTIPPEGVNVVTTAGDFTTINTDRTANTQNYFTTHTLPTTYTYNSLNQLVRQSIPDHDLMNIWEFGLPNGLDSRLKVTATQFINSSKGYLTGYIDFTTPTVFKRGYLYTTDDGGVSWTKMNDLIASDLKKVQMVSATIGYAIGTNGIVLKTIDAGNSWDMFPIPVVATLNDLYFTSTLNGIVIGENSSAYKTIDGGTTWTTLTGVPASASITAVTYDGASFYFTVSTVANGPQLFKAAVTAPTTTSFAIASWTNTASIQLASDISKIQLVTTTEGFAIAKDGSLLKTITGGTEWQLVPTGFATGFTDIYFKTPVSGAVLEGVAIIDSILPGKGIIYKTQDGGITWTRLSPVDGSYYKAFHFYQNDKGYVVGNTKIKRIVMTAAGNFGLVNIPFSNSDIPNFTTVYFTDADNGWVVNSRKAWFTHNATAGTPVWKEIEYGPGPFVIKKFYFGNTQNSGLALGTAGELYKIIPMGNIYEMEQIAFPSATEYYVDIDVTSTRVYAFNKMGTTQNLKYVLRSDVSNILTASGGGLGAGLPATNISCMDIQSGGTFLCVGGASGILYKGASLNTSATWADYTKTIKPLALCDIESAGTNTIYAVGKEGSIFQTLNGGTLWKMLPKNTTNQYNSIKFNKSGTTTITAVNGLIAGDKGLLTKADITVAGVVTTSTIPLNTTAALNDIALNTANKAYVSGNEGTVISIPTIITPVPVVAATKPAVDFKGVCYIPSSNTILTVANNANIYKYNNLTGAKINTLYTPGLTGLSFSNVTDGYVIGEKNTIRYTSNAGVNWNLVTRSVATAMNAVHSWTPGKAVIVGDNGYIGIVTGTNLVTNTTYAGTAALYDVKVASNQTGFIVGNNIALKTTNGGTNWATFTANPVIPATTIFRSLHLFRNNSFVAVGDAGKIYCYNGTGWISHPSSASGNLKRVFFHDDRNGYIVGDAGTIYRFYSPNTNMSAYTSATTLSMNLWTAQVLTGNNGITTPSTVNLTTIAFANRYQGFIGGSLTSGASPNYARLITDESNLFSTRFWYDRLGRMVLSQNTKQYTRKGLAAQTGRSDFSYTLYDDLGRIVEVGEKTDNVASATVTPFHRILGDYVNGQYNPLTVNPDSLKEWINDGSARREVTHTYYDNAVTGLPGTIVQQNLRKRIASISYEDVADANPLTYQHATHYTYDIHGNVKTLWQENKDITVSGQSLKRMDYEYDLISGKVNVVRYQDGQPDAFYHYYNYDADNRITEVYTSAYPQAGQIINQRVVQDNPLWSKDAKYFYYAHGPLARVEEGENQSQGVDYAYTLQGWIKGVNSNLLNANNDMGNDGLASNPAHKNTGKDAFGYTLNYFQGDYAAIDGVKWNAATTRFEAYTAGSDLMAARSDLYNGNISAMATTLSAPKLYSSAANEVPTLLPQATAYKYDQLNRLLDMQAYTNINSTSGNANYNKWLSGSSYANRYKDKFTYDANGNIKTHWRANAAGTIIDSSRYIYMVTPTGARQNRLKYVTDNVAAGTHADDIDNQGNSNYRYDSIGNLTGDIQEQIARIEWNVYGKIKKIIRTGPSTKSDLEFKYDASGNRIAKIEKPDGSSLENGGANNPSLWKITYYTRDAQGNVMSTYKQTSSGSTSFKQIERNLFGSNRLGTENTAVEMVSALPLASPYPHVLGNKMFEGSNHLGNVLSVFTDKKIPRDDNTDGVIDYFQPEVIACNDYTPFGAPMTERNFSSLNYRYGFNGKEKDDEIKQTGNSYDFGARIYDPRLGRFLSVDPKASSFPWQSPYAAFDNSPIWKNDPTGESGEVTINKQSKTITITSNLTLYGGASSVALAKSTAKDIQDKWNAAAGKVKIDGVEYKVQFSVTGSYNENLTAADISKNTDIKNNYIRVEETVAGNISYMDNAGSNTGYYLLSNIKGDGSTTEGHEFGHGYGLEHPEDGDLRGEGQPGIMAARGTLVDGKYQYNPKAKAGEAGGTINPEKRKVTKGDINNLGLDKLKFDKSGKANLGKLTNKHHEKTK